MKKIKVLMVDDEAQFRQTTSRLLIRKGYETTVASTGEEALSLIKKDKPDVVILDVKMPGMDGHVALEKIKDIDEDIQVIMLTGHGARESAKTSLKRGAFDYLAKPCDIDRLAARIRDAYLLSHDDVRSEKSAGDLMIPIEEYTTISPEASIREGIEKLNDSFGRLVSTDKIMQTGHRSILVMDKNQLAGIFSIMDLIAALRPAYLSAPKPSMAYSMEYSAMFWSGLFTSQAKQISRKKIFDVMSPPPPSVKETANLMELANILYETECRRLIVRRDEKVIGVIREQEIFFEAADIILSE